MTYTDHLAAAHRRLGADFSDVKDALLFMVGYYTGAGSIPVDQVHALVKDWPMYVDVEVEAVAPEVETAGRETFEGDPDIGFSEFWWDLRGRRGLDVTGVQVRTLLKRLRAGRVS